MSSAPRRVHTAPSLLSLSPPAATTAHTHTHSTRPHRYTDVFEDSHTRAALVRGGCIYTPASGAWTSQWYFRQAKRIDQHNKYYLMDDSYDRAATLGFRCVQDAAGQGEGTCWTVEASGKRECV